MLEKTEKWVESLAKSVAVLGGIVLTAVALMTVVSIIGRASIKLGLSPIPGDFELVEAGVAFVVCAFLPWGQLKRGHASVAILTDNMGKTVNLTIDLIADFLLLATSLVITWRHILGLLDKQRYGETTFILQYPLWWAYAVSLVGLVTWIVVGIWCVANGADALARNFRSSKNTGVAR